MKNFIIVIVFLLNLNANIIKVKEQKVSNKKTFYALTKYDETKVNDVVLRFSGYIKNLNANSTHKFIKKGDLLFKVYSKELSSALDELVISMKYKQNRLQIKAIEDRLKLLGISSSTIRYVKRTKKVPYYINIYSKYSGVIINKKINEQSYIKAGETLFSLVDLSTIWVDANIYQKDIEFIKKGMDAKIYVSGVGEFNSKVDLIHPIVENKTKTIPVRLIVDNKKKKLFPNMFAKVEFINKAKTMLILPKSAVITKGDKNYVFKPLENNEYEPIEIKAVRIDSKIFQIKDGLKKGDKVINNSLFMLDSDAITNGLYDSDDDDW